MKNGYVSLFEILFGHLFNSIAIGFFLFLIKVLIGEEDEIIDEE